MEDHGAQRQSLEMESWPQTLKEASGESLPWAAGRHTSDVRSCEKTSMTETEGMRASTDGDEIRKIMKNQ